MASRHPNWRLRQQSNRLRAIVLTAACVLSGCANLKYGPLAVVREDDHVAAQARGGEGRLEIGRCVTLVMELGARELVWRDSQAEWNPLTGQIVFRDPTRGTFVLSSGDMIGVGGMGLSDDAPVTWLTRPSGCGTDPFVVHEVKFLARP